MKPDRSTELNRLHDLDKLKRPGPTPEQRGLEEWANVILRGDKPASKRRKRRRRRPKL